MPLMATDKQTSHATIGAIPTAVFCFLCDKKVALLDAATMSSSSLSITLCSIYFLVKHIYLVLNISSVKVSFAVPQVQPVRVAACHQAKSERIASKSDPPVAA